MSAAQWETLIAVLVPLCMALTALATAVTAQLGRSARMHQENSDRLDRIEAKVDKP